MLAADSSAAQVSGPKNASDEGAMVLNPQVVVQGSRRFSVVWLKLPDGTERPVYFDLTDYFGK